MTDPVCEVGEPHRSACQGQTWYAEHEGKRYCVLHYPSKEKAADVDSQFQTVVRRKLEQRDFDFAGVYFPDYLEDFASTVFDSEANFLSATFENGVDFSETTFKKRADFFGATFRGKADFSRTTFEDTAMFAQATFYTTPYEKEAKLFGAIFRGVANFSGTTFELEDDREKNTNSSVVKTDLYHYATVDFSRTTFEDIAYFSDGTTFEGGVRFSEAVFKKEASFVAATFKKAAFFAPPLVLGVVRRVTFKELADFHNTTFEEAYFSDADFEGGANFVGTTFERQAAFGGAVFEKEVDFSRAPFEKQEGRGEKFEDGADFSGAIFKEAVSFSGLEGLNIFSSKADVRFQNARIDKPERFSFSTVRLRPSWFIDVDAQRFDFSDVEWFKQLDGTKLKLEDEIEALEKRDIGQPYSLRKLSTSCRRLSMNYEENRDYPLANDLYHWSMEALRKEGYRRLGIIRTMYWALSGYGVKPGHAFGVLLAIWVVFAALYVLVPSSEFYAFSPSNAGQVINGVGQAIVYSMATMARLNPEPKPDPSWFQLLVTIEALLGPLQIGLLLLAIRRKVMR